MQIIFKLERKMLRFVGSILISHLPINEVAYTSLVIIKNFDLRYLTDLHVSWLQGTEK